MALIPTSQQDIIQPLDFSGMFSGSQKLADAYIQRKKEIAQDQRLKKQAIDKVRLQLNAALPALKGHQEKASQMIEEFEDYIANAFTYNDKKGDNKLKNFFGEPELTDEENVEVMSRAAQIGATINKWIKDDELTAKEIETYKNAKAGTYDAELYNMRHNDYTITNDRNGSLLEVAPANVYDYLGKLDPRTPEDIKAGISQTLEGSNWVYNQKGLDPLTQKQIYYGAAKNDYAFQKGLVDLMMRDNSMSTNAKVEYLVGNMIPNINELDTQNPAHRDIINRTYAEAQRVVGEYQNERKFDPKLIDAAADYNDQFYNLSGKIGKANTWKEPNEAIINDAIRKAREKAEEDKGTTTLQEREITFAGNKYENYVDVSNVESTNTTLTGYKLPSDAIKYVEKRDLKTGKTIPIKGESAIRIKNPIETKTEDDYIIAGWDKNKNVIRLIKKNREGLTKRGYPKTGETKGEALVRDEESYMIPYVGNENMINEIVKKLGIGEEYLESTTKWQKYKR